ncbi:MAG: putative permease, superfamily [Naasia sp.]|nr:putative permease, superfamily [Naasia sp.]
MGYVYALLSAILFGTNGSVAKVVLQAGIDPGQLTFLRCLGSALLAGAALLVLDRRAFRLSRRDLGRAALLGLIGVAAVQWLYAVAIARVPVGIVLLLEYLAVPLVALVAWLVLGERVRVRLWIAIALVVGGLAVVAQGGDATLDLFGVVAAIGGAASLACYFLLGQRGVAASSPLVLAFWSMLFAAAFWSVASGWWNLSPAVFAAAAPDTGGAIPVWVALLWVIVMGSFAPYLLSYFAIRRLGATRGGILAAAEVVFAFAAAWLWLGETLTGPQVLGAAVVLAGIVVAQTARSGPPVDADLAIARAPSPGARLTAGLRSRRQRAGSGVGGSS